MEKLGKKKMTNGYGSAEFYAELFADLLADVQADHPHYGDNLIVALNLHSDWKDCHQKQTAECDRLLKELMKKSDYIEQLCEITRKRAKNLQSNNYVHL